MGSSNAVFIGHVNAAAGTKALGDVPETQFTVKVQATLKGTVGRSVIVNQEGGVDARDGSTVLYEGDQLLRAGHTYVFATRFHKDENWHTVLPVWGSIDVTDLARSEATDVGNKFHSAVTYQIDNEAARELANKTVHDIMHLGWVPTGDGAYELRMAALVKPNGLFGRLYMAAIAPFRYLIVYPALTRQWERAWLDLGRPQRRAGQAARRESRQLGFLARRANAVRHSAPRDR